MENARQGKKNTLRHWLAAVAFFVLPFASHSQASPAASSGNDSLTLWLGGSVLDFGYKEFTPDGDVSNREDGLLPGVRLGLEYYWEKNQRLTLDLTHHDGVADYDGQTQSGTPLTTLTDEAITHLNFTLGGMADAFDDASAYWGLGYRQWQRNIRSRGSVQGLLETYMWPYVLLGLQGGVWRGGRSHLVLDGRLLYPVSPKIRIESDSFDTVTLRQKSTPGLRLALPWRTYGRRLHVEIEAALEIWRVTRSAAKEITINGQPTGYVVYEPSSTTIQPGITLSVGF